ncbi:MAG: MBL fold metallo-hydrolase [Candidatus Lokiarchaeota archaeon]|nr:MBL fold metallo-hydrolase [Candidatus Lokiarchaeota archaeon]
MQVQIYGGANEIGGNQVFISEGNKNFMFDFGVSFSDMKEFFSEYLKPRSLNGILDYLYLKLIPPIDGLYRNDLINRYKDILSKPKYKIKPTTPNYVDAFFLSHAHLDHYKFMSFLKKNTPIYLNWTANSILSYINDIKSDKLMRECLSFHEYWLLLPKSSGSGKMKRAKIDDYEDIDTTRKINILEDEHPIYLETDNGKCKVTQYQVDHSIPGSTAFIIEHDGRNIVYTGDFRKHGLHPEWTNRFIKMCKKASPIAIITDGTNVPSIKSYRDDNYHQREKSEHDIRKQSDKIIKNNSGLILVNFPSRSLDRALMYYQLAKKHNRTFAVNTKIWKMIDYFRNKIEKTDDDFKDSFLKNYPLPEPEDEYLKPYLQRKKWGYFELKDYKKFERTILKTDDYVTYKEIKQSQENYLLYLDFYMLKELIDIDPDPGKTVYLKSITDPFDEEMIIKEQKLDAWLKHFQIRKTKTIHSSGHCRVNELRDMLNEINADNVIPIHTEHPETFKEFGLSSEIIQPEIGKRYSF